MKFGLTLPNRGVLFGVTTTEELLQMAEIADRSEQFASVWVGDSLLGKPRFEALTLLAGIAARTWRVRLGPACMASFSLRDPVLLAYQWASLDLMAGGRTVLVACTGIVEQEGAKLEAALYRVTPRDRVRRLIEWIKILKLLWTEDQVSFQGEYYQFEGITLEPKPAAKPRPPIWIASNAGRSGLPDRAAIERTHRRAARHADGWETSLWDVDDLAWRLEDIRQKVREEGKDPATFEFHLYHNFNINDDRAAALDEAKRFLDIYYSTDFSPQHIAGWTAAGSPEQCIEHLRRYKALGFTEVTLRPASWDQRGQLARLMRDVLPYV